MEPHLSRCSTPNSFGYIIFITSSPSADPVSTAFTAHPGSWNPLPSLQIPKSELLHPTPPAWNPSTGSWVLSDCHLKFHSCCLSIGVKIKSPNTARELHPSGTHQPHELSDLIIPTASYQPQPSSFTATPAQGSSPVSSVCWLHFFCLATQLSFYYDLKVPPKFIY